ncbi:LysR family transcriptional regulator [Pseudolabrys taiwanensis]|uniref:LysR family transcriptional regulator n=2 Tax=Pseudolabrys taiwanensis TaxID=331696 RepID=A0A346A3H1_9HYPH|nr:LysR family transcriptional regulator [Pseudolabrys taiwanensis]
MTLDPKRLMELLSIAETGSFTKAAAARRVSQPALSNSMALLEKALGVRVLERGRGGAALTEYGRLLTTHAQALAALLARANDDVRLRRQGLEGQLTIGASPLACVDLVPNAIATVERKSPNVRVQVEERPDDQLMHGLRTGAFDVIVSPAGAETDAPDVVCETLLSDVPVVMVRRGHPLARRRRVTLKELSDVRWVFPSAHTAMWRHIEALFTAWDIAWPASYVTTNSVLALRSLVLRTDSVTISSPHLMKLELASGRLIGIPLAKPHFVREIVLRTRRAQPLSPLAARFVAALRTEAAALRRA